MARGQFPFERVAIVGLGLMGGSLGMAIRAVADSSGTAGGSGKVTVVGWNRTRERMAEALADGIIDEAAETVEAAAAGADLVVIATPVSTIARLAIEASSRAADGAVVTDVGSVKRVVVESVDERIAEGRHFVGGHPMCGSELAGLDAARADLYEGATWVLTPTEKTDDDAFSRIQSMVNILGGRVLAVRPDLHDRFVAIVSHLPHLSAASLLNVAAEEATGAEALLSLAAGGFRDVTRIASGSPALWTDICSVNRDAIGEALGLMIDELERVREAISTGGLDALSSRLEAARDARALLPIGPAAAEELFEVSLPVPDRPGVLAEISTLVGGLGINIADLTISHSVEGTGGLLQIVISGEAEADRALDALRERGYSGTVRSFDESEDAAGI